MNMKKQTNIQLTKFSHGAGCGCKISPKLLAELLETEKESALSQNLLVGNSSKDDAAVLDLGNGTGLISTTDFFMPIVDDAHAFGKISAANAISDVYAMGARPVLAIAILGWPIKKIAVSECKRVLQGAREICTQAKVPLAGGHSIDSPEPIFGLAVNGLINLQHLKRNNTAKAGNLLFLTKPLGIGILTTAEKKGKLQIKDKALAESWMVKLNSAGEIFGKLTFVKAMTDVTGFGLLGHLLEICAGSGVSAEIDFSKVPLITELEHYIEIGCVPGGTRRNWQSIEENINAISETQKSILCDPQTSGGLLVAVAPSGYKEFQEVLQANGLAGFTRPIGELKSKTAGEPMIFVRA